MCNNCVTFETKSTNNQYVMSGLEGKQRGELKGRSFVGGYRPESIKIYKDVGKWPKFKNPY